MRGLTLPKVRGDGNGDIGLRASSYPFHAAGPVPLGGGHLGYFAPGGAAFTSVHPLRPQLFFRRQSKDLEDQRKSFDVNRLLEEPRSALQTRNRDCASPDASVSAADRGEELIDVDTISEDGHVISSDDSFRRESPTRSAFLRRISPLRHSPRRELSRRCSPLRRDSPPRRDSPITDSPPPPRRRSSPFPNNAGIINLSLLYNLQQARISSNETLLQRGTVSLLPAAPGLPRVPDTPLLLGLRHTLLRSNVSPPSDDEDMSIEEKGTHGRKKLSGDDRKLMAVGIPLDEKDRIVNMPSDELTEYMTNQSLSEEAISMLKDIRRRGKNKIAAQNCRKRKIDQVEDLANKLREAERVEDEYKRKKLSAEAEKTSMDEEAYNLYILLVENHCIRVEHCYKCNKPYDKECFGHNGKEFTEADLIK